MDQWRHKIQQLNERRSRKTAEKRYGLIALILLVVIAVSGMSVLFTASPTSEGDSFAMTTPQPDADGFALFDAGDYEAALEKLRPLAEEDDARAQFTLGVALTRVADADQRHRQIEAIKWLDQCVRRHDYPNAGERETARSLINDFIKTAGWDIVGEARYLSFQFQQVKLNEEQGRPSGAPESIMSTLGDLDGQAAFQLGADLYNGNGMLVDYEKGTRAFHRAAEFGIPEAAFNLGIAYYVGKGVKADPVQALRWFRVGADGAFAQAATMTGVMLARGEGQAQDIEQAIRYLQLAEELGDEDAGMMAEAIAAGAIPE